MSFYVTRLPDPKAIATLARRFKISKKALEVGLSLRIEHAAWERRFDAALREHGLGGGRFSILVHLWIAGPVGLMPSEIAEAMGVTRGNLTALIHALCRLRCLRKIDDKNDKRAFRLVLTDKGKDLLENLGPEYFAIYDEMYRRAK